ncbi:MAG: TIGR02147 family protein [Bacteriovoracaceae bacterium]
MSSIKKVSIFDYIDLSEYLQDFIKSKESASKAYSFRSLALKLEGISYSQLYQIIKGKKRFPLSLTSEMSQYVLKLNRQELKYFRALVEINHYIFEEAAGAKMDDLKKNLHTLKPLNIKHIEFNEINSRPLTMIVFEMIGRPDIKYVTQICPEIFYHKYSMEKIQESLNYLNQSGHITIGPEGELSRLLPHLMSSNDIPNEYIRNYHKEVSTFVSSTIDITSVSEREFQSYAININKAELPKAKELIRNFMHDFARQMENTPSDPNSTYNLNLQFFPLIKDHL